MKIDVLNEIIETDHIAAITGIVADFIPVVRKMTFKFSVILTSGKEIEIGPALSIDTIDGVRRTLIDKWCGDTQLIKIKDDAGSKQ